MAEAVITLRNLTKDYGKDRGIFDINLEVQKGEVLGYIGTNGSGKTTTIRNLMGFVKPDQGSASVLGYNAWEHSVDIKRHVSYVPGEIAFPRLSTGTAFLKVQAEYLGIKDYTYMNYLIQKLQLDPSANLRRMSKGMKQKTALVAALMGNKEILILDEPSTGLDPLMRDVFLDLIREEITKGKTIFMSSQIIEEMEEVCDRVAVINNGHILGILDAKAIRHQMIKNFSITFDEISDCIAFCDTIAPEELLDCKGNTCSIRVPVEKVGYLLGELRNYPIQTLIEQHKTLEEEFKKIYRNSRNGEQK